MVAGGADGSQSDQVAQPSAEELAWLQSALQSATFRDDDEADWTDPSNGKLQSLFELLEEEKYDEALDLISELEPAHLDHPGPDGDTLLHLSCLYGQLACVQKLLERGANAAVVNASDNTLPLHDACAGGYLEIVQLLLERAPDNLDAPDEDGDTPLHCAARGDHLEVVKLLISRGADISAENAAGNTPADEAEEDQVKAALRPYVENGAGKRVENGQ